MDTLDALRLIGIYKLSASGREDDAILRLRDLVLDGIEDQCSSVLGEIDFNRLSPPILFWLLIFLPTVGLKQDTLYLRVRAHVSRFCLHRGPSPFPLASPRSPSPLAWSKS